MVVAHGAARSTRAPHWQLRTMQHQWHAAAAVCAGGTAGAALFDAPRWTAAATAPVLPVDGAAPSERHGSEHSNTVRFGGGERAQRRSTASGAAIDWPIPLFASVALSLLLLPLFRFLCLSVLCCLANLLSPLCVLSPPLFLLATPEYALSTHRTRHRYC